jgi:hypothetical protein
MSKAFAVVLAQRFSPLNFSAVPGFPHPVPHMSEWGDFLPIFRERKEDNPAQHLIKFHQCMDQLDLYHEDVLMKMFMHSLDGDACQWYFSLPHSSISSLREFHSTFNEHYKRYFSAEFLFENCCEEFEKNIQHTIGISSDCKAEIDVFVEEIKEKSYHSFPSFPVLKADFVDCSYDEEISSNAIDVPNFSYPCNKMSLKIIPMMR